MTAKKSTSKESNKIDYADITEAEVQSVWPDLCMADRYQIAHAKISQNMSAWRADTIAEERAGESNSTRQHDSFIKEVIELAESDNFNIN
jgi:hypothetical protein